MATLAITGVTGSLGKAILAEQDFLKAQGITKIIGLSRDEQKQVALQREYAGKIPLRLYLADVTDKERMQFALKHVEYVIHAAAQKHIDKFESDIPTGYRTNITGTQNVAAAFMDSDCAKSGIMVSTDKAVMPVTAYGISKLAAQQLWLWHNVYQKKVPMGAVVYGNVYASRGSVIESWTEKAKLGEALPITDMNCTRFFIELSKSAQFVLFCLFNNEKKVHVPEMKAAYMTEVGSSIWKYWQKNKAVSFETIGMRGTEKLDEILVPNGPTSAEVEQFTSKELDSMYRSWLSDKE